MIDMPPTRSPGPDAQGIIQRAKDILVKPREAWAVIDTEPATTQSIYVPYVLILAAIGPLAGLIGGQVFGYSFLNITYRPPIGGAIASAVLSYALTLASVYVVALVIDGLAPTFGGQKNPVQALKVSAYSATASWLAGIFSLIPALEILGIVGLYSLYLIYVGLPIVMKAPPEKALAYTAVVVLVAVALFIVIGIIVAGLTAPSLMGASL